MEKVEGKPIPVQEGNEVVVIGGGFTAFDCTRTSLRLGAKVHTMYRRGRAEMGATLEEVEDGEAEGTHLQLYVSQTRIVTENGKVRVSSSRRTNWVSLMQVVVAVRCLSLDLSLL